MSTGLQVLNTVVSLPLETPREMQEWDLGLILATPLSVFKSVLKLVVELLGFLMYFGPNPVADDWSRTISCSFGCLFLCSVFVCLFVF